MSLPSLKIYHKAPYATISPKRPELGQDGRTVVITGGNSGIGYAIARGFVTASAKRVIILGRRPDVVASAASKLAGEAEQLGSSTLIDGRVADVSNLESTAKLWAGLEKDGIVVDVLVLNAAAAGAVAPILETSRDQVWGDFETNVRSALDFTDRFYKQSGKGATAGKFLVNVSSCASYMFDTMGPDRPTYGLTKNASTLLLQQIAKDTDADVLQIVSFHPGGILTDLGKSLGFDENCGIDFDDENLPGHVAVWAASKEAKFLHGRFIWANWDIDEIKSGEIGRRIEEKKTFLKFGIEGLEESMGSPLPTHDEITETITKFFQAKAPVQESA